MLSKVWKIYVRLPSNAKYFEDYASDCHKAAVVAIGYSELRDLNIFESKEDIKKKLIKIDGNFKDNPIGLGQWASMLWKFCNDVKINDYILMHDKISEKIYIGIVRNGYEFSTPKPFGKCEWRHRIKVKWLNIIDDARFTPSGGYQSITELKIAKSEIIKLSKSRPSHLKIKNKQFKSSMIPDKEWGLKVEKRAIQWLIEKGRKPKDVSKQNFGWDLECGNEKFEVKGRKSLKTVIRLTANEFNAAKKYGDNYILLIFTAQTEANLKNAKPKQIPNPHKYERWFPKATYEYFLIENQK